ncbi:hypothetical protein CEE36_04630 [candidate division TA06 bacterium B3_TA06]|uniref:Secretion system C-terminal sorting domain-containing protein n=1 Tax=candidate division TA06 bacterium B3_TA06 TaxID=2012487 RepID=A0A532V857_UNCT6|nr:MAG: hypothetical protein CEE36_04630 [candidate division TA06 bacterium B3_TA06]
MKRICQLSVAVSLLLVTIPLYGGWIRTYGGEYGDRGKWVEQTSDGGYIITGHFGLPYNPYLHQDLYLLKVDSVGDTLWARNYWALPTHMAEGYCVQQTSDGGYVIVGMNFTRLWVLKTDENGDTLWTLEWGVSGPCVREAQDDGYIITGSASTQEYGYELLVSKIDTGRVVWTREYGGEYRQEGTSLQLTSDGGYIVTGVTEQELGGPNDPWLLKTDVDGDSLWARAYSVGDEELNARSDCVQETSDGGYIISGITNGSLFILKTDSVGDSLWARIYGDGVTDGTFRTSICQTANGGYIIASTKRYSDSTSAVWLLKANELGDTLWTRTFGNAWDRNRSNCVQVTSDGGYIITGYMESYSPGGSKDILLIKTDSLGYVSVEEEPVMESVIQLSASLNRLSYDVPGEAQLTLYSADGRKVLEETIEGKGIWTPSPPSSLLPAGVYFARVKSNSSSAVGKIVILH